MKAVRPEPRLRDLDSPFYMDKTFHEQLKDEHIKRLAYNKEYYKRHAGWREYLAAWKSVGKAYALNVAFQRSDFERVQSYIDECGLTRREIKQDALYS